MSLFKGLLGAKEKKPKLECPACNAPLNEENQIGPGDNAAVMADLGILQVKLKCPKCHKVFDITFPVNFEWKASVDIPGRGRFPKQPVKQPGIETSYNQAGATTQVDAIALVCDQLVTFDSEDSFNNWVRKVVYPKYPGVKLPAREQIKVSWGTEAEARTRLVLMLQQIVTEARLDEHKYFKEFFSVQSKSPPMKVWGVALTGETSTETSDAMRIFIASFRSHLDRVRRDAPQFRPFLDEYFGDAAIHEIACVAANKMDLTRSDSSQHSAVLEHGEVIFHITTLPVDIGKARDWFKSNAGGYINLLENAWNSYPPNFPGSVWCHIIYGISGETRWTHLALWPIKQPSPLESILYPVEFLDPNEIQMFERAISEQFDLSIASKGDQGSRLRTTISKNEAGPGSILENRPATAQEIPSTGKQGEKMMSNEDVILQYLQQLGAPATTFNDLPGVTSVRSTIVTYMDLRFEVQILSNQMLVAQFVIGYAPAIGADQLLRHLLILNSLLISVYFCVFGANNLIVLRSSRTLAGLDYIEFKQSLDLLCNAFMQNGRQAVQMFQIAQQAAQTSLPTTAEPKESMQAWEQQMIDFLRQGRKIEAIKVYRQYANAGLNEAKDYVDRLEQSLK